MQHQGVLTKRHGDRVIRTSVITMADHPMSRSPDHPISFRPIAECFCYNVGMPSRPASPAFAKKTTKPPPPDDTGMEPAYLKALGEKQTPVMVKLLSGETFRGWIEYYDVAMIRLTREGAPNLFIFKHEIMYIAEDNGRRNR